MVGTQRSVERAFYFLRRAASNLRLNLFTTSMNIFTLSASLVMLGTFYVLFGLFQNAAPSWLTEIKAVAYLHPQIDDAAGEALSRKLQQWPEVEQADWVPKEVAWQRLKAELEPYQDLFDGFDANPLPASIEITFHPVRDPNRDLEPLLQHLRNLAEVESVQTGKIWLDRFDALLQLTRFIAGGIVILVILITVVIISNTVKLTIFARLDELEIYRIIGAGSAFTKIPFYLEAVLQAAISAVLALFPLQALTHLMRRAIPEPFAGLLPGAATHSLSLLLALTVTGICLTGAGSWLAMRRFLKT